MLWPARLALDLARELVWLARAGCRARSMPSPDERPSARVTVNGLDLDSHERGYLREDYERPYFSSR